MSKKIQPLNYCNQAIKSIDEHWLPMLNGNKMEVAAHNMYFTAGHLRQATKYIIPNGDSILDQKLPHRSELAKLHLPYPVVAIEYCIENVRVTQAAPVPSKRRISLVFEINGDENDVFPIHPQSPMYGSGGWVIVPLWHEPTHDNWCITHTAIAVKRHQSKREGSEGLTRLKYEDENDEFLTHENLTDSEVARILAKIKDDQTRVLLDYDTYETIFLPEIIGDLIEQFGSQKIKEVTLRDTFDEVVTAMAFLYASSCKNIKTQLINTVKPTVNKKREAKGKLPFFEYHALVIDMSKPKKVYVRKTPDPERTKRRSPKWHIRTGHPRWIQSLGEHRWIANTSVGDPTNGIVEKDYFLFTGE